MTTEHEDYLEACADVDDFYKGRPEARARADFIARAHTITWDDVKTYAAVYPEHERAAEDEIERLLGYFPYPTIVMPHEVFIRTLIEQRKRGEISADRYEHELMMHVIHIRNDDIAKSGFLRNRHFSMDWIVHYYDVLPDFITAAQDRIMAYFGELPEIATRLQPEMWLRRHLADEPDLFAHGFNPIDKRVFTAIEYRKVWLEHGQKEADASPLLRRKFTTPDQRNSAKLAN